MKKGKKLTSEILSVRGDKPGNTVGGVFLGMQQMFTMDNQPLKGNYDQDLYTMELADFKSGEISKYWVDGGLRGALKMAKVQVDQKIFIEHTGAKKIDEGTVQTYEIYGAE